MIDANQPAPEPLATPVALAVNFDGQRVDVAPLTLQQIIDISRELHGLVPALVPVIDALQSGKDAAAALLGLLGQHGEAMLHVIARSTGVELGALQRTTDLAAVVALAVAIVRVNVDFFGQQASEIGATLAAVRNGAGKTGSTNSSAAATR